MEARGRVMQRGRHAWIAVLVGLCSTMLFAGRPANAAAQLPELLWQAPEDGKKGAGAGRVNNPPGVATDPNTGHVFVTDFGNSRVNEFDAWGQFVQAWGWDVAPEGAPGDTRSEEHTAELQ